MPHSAPDSSTPGSAESVGPLPLIPPVGAPTLRPGTGRRPLPDAVAVYSVPEIAPPFDDATARPGPTKPRTARAGAARAGAEKPRQREAGQREATEGRLGPTAKRPAARRKNPAAANPAGSSAQPTTARPTSASAQPPAHGNWPSQFAQVLAETLAGSRPPRQIAPWTTEQTRRRISQLGSLLASAQQPRVRRVIVTCPARDVLEMTIIVGLGQRVRAVAVRLERTPAAQAARAPGQGDRDVPGTPTCPSSGSGASQPAQAATHRPDNTDPRRQADRWYCTAVEAA